MKKELSAPVPARPGHRLFLDKKEQKIPQNPLDFLTAVRYTSLRCAEAHYAMMQEIAGDSR